MPPSRRREHARQRLDEARRRGGFVAVKASIAGAAPVIDRLTRLDGVTAVNVTQDLYYPAQGHRRRSRPPPLGHRPRPPTTTLPRPPPRPASPASSPRPGSASSAHPCAAPSGIVLLHDATPLARYTGGAELLARLAVAARQSGESPHGLWLLCPMQDPKDPPRLDAMTVGVIPGDAEQLVS